MAGKAPHFNLGFSTLNDGQLDDKVNLIRENMTGNVNYTTPGSRISDVTDAQGNYTLIKGKIGTVLNYEEIKKTGRQDLIDTLITLGIWARDKYPGDVTIWKTTGYTIQVYDTVTEQPGVPIEVKGQDGEHFGTAVISCKKVKFATGYQGRFCKKGDAMPVGIAISQKKLRLLFLNLEQGVAYNFQMRASGTRGYSDWGTIVTWILRIDPNAGGGATGGATETPTPDAPTPDAPTPDAPTT